MSDESTWLPPVRWKDTYVEAATTFEQQEVGKSVQKRRASKVKAVEQLAEQTIKFSGPMLCLASNGCAVQNKTAVLQTGGMDAVQGDDAPAAEQQSKPRQEWQPSKASELAGKKTKINRASEEAPKAKGKQSGQQQKLIASEAIPGEIVEEKTRCAENNKRKVQQDNGAEATADIEAVHGLNPDGRQAKKKRRSNKKRKNSAAVTAETTTESGGSLAEAACAVTEDPGSTVVDEQSAQPVKDSGRSSKDTARPHKHMKKEKDRKVPATSAAPASGKKSSKPSALDKLKSNLQGGRFRMLNEKLYTTQGGEAFKMMQGSPELFTVYHEGFRVQANSWSKNPVELALKWLRTKPEGWTVADFGCGDAQIAQELCNTHSVHSFDLCANNKHVTACNMANVPCNSEVRSRFVPEDMSTENFAPFLTSLQKLGFKILKQDVGNRMFVVWIAKKVKDDSVSGIVQWPVLKPCIYKRR